MIKEVDFSLYKNKFKRIKKNIGLMCHTYKKSLIKTCCKELFCEGKS